MPLVTIPFCEKVTVAKRANGSVAPELLLHLSAPPHHSSTLDREGKKTVRWVFLDQCFHRYPNRGIRRQVVTKLTARFGDTADIGAAYGISHADYHFNQSSLSEGMRGSEQWRQVRVEASNSRQEHRETDWPNSDMDLVTLPSLSRQLFMRSGHACRLWPNNLHARFAFNRSGFEAYLDYLLVAMQDLDSAVEFWPTSYFLAKAKQDLEKVSASAAARSKSQNASLKPKQAQAQGKKRKRLSFDELTDYVLENSIHTVGDLWRESQLKSSACNFLSLAEGLLCSASRRCRSQGFRHCTRGQARSDAIVGRGGPKFCAAQSRNNTGCFGFTFDDLESCSLSGRSAMLLWWSRGGSLDYAFKSSKWRGRRTTRRVAVNVLRRSVLRTRVLLARVCLDPPLQIWVIGVHQESKRCCAMHYEIVPIRTWTLNARGSERAQNEWLAYFTMSWTSGSCTYSSPQSQVLLWHHREGLAKTGFFPNVEPFLVLQAIRFQGFGF